ncbi:hypothetical protein LSH36_140g01059 [Paralvinella palmiformis]|uniref:Uncharacterized protein n=1 Tax=Paralvinella palmiformis TaxID=53620 RepID=A0AAD9JVH9_9ANNE|nr:hypothetical protein LSH36_140g01059 [Paralvinella palmiformis]
MVNHLRRLDADAEVIRYAATTVVHLLFLTWELPVRKATTMCIRTEEKHQVKTVGRNVLMKLISTTGKRPPPS